MRTRFYPAPEFLARDVIGIRVIQGVAPKGTAVRTCAMATPGLVFHIGSNGPSIEQITTRTHTYTGLPPLFLHGCRLEPSIMLFKEGPYMALQVGLEPWALKTLFGINGSLLTSRPFGAADFGATSLQTALLTHNASATRVAFIQDYLGIQFERHNKRDILVEASVQYIEQHLASITVKELAEHFGVSERSLQKRYAAFIGCPPSKFIQIKRVNEALRLMWTGEYQKLADVAHALNYYDQAHFIRDMKTFSWLTPKVITQSISDFRQDESGIAYVQ